MKGKNPAAIRRYSHFFTLSFIALLVFGFYALQLRSFPVKAQSNEFSPSALGYTENFDAVTAPALPANWTTARTGTNTLFATVNSMSHTPPNAIFTNDPATVGTSEIVSPVIRVGGNFPKLIFRHRYDSESSFDGGVLEIKIGNGAFQDILAAGGSFVSGGYNSTISPNFMNPLANRQAWSGASNVFITTEVNLPAASFRQLVQFKWKFGSDSSIADVGWWVDSAQVTNVVTGENTTSIVFPGSGTATPYPSEINISDLPGKVTNVIVNVENFSHSAPDDVDLMLVSPTGRSVVLMSDVGGGNAVNNLSLTFEDEAVNSLPDSTTLVSGSYKPTDFETGDAYPTPAPQGAPTGTKLGAFFNDQPNGAWKLFAVDDSGENVGNITGGWSIIVDSSPTAIAIQASGVSDPYPSGITISGQLDLVSKVTVGVESFDHTAPDDVDLMLVAPNGRKIILMSDVGGNAEVNNLTFTFDDAAAQSLPDDAPLVSGTFKPTNYESGDVFPAPAPAGGLLGTKLSVFNGSDANGVWQLFLVDDNGNNAGTINAWSLNIQTTPGVIGIPEVGTASPYPANKLITGLQGNVTKVVVTLTNFSHTLPDDVDILLAAPNGRKVVLMSDAGGVNEVGPINLTFDDAGGANLPDSTVLITGIFKPTDFEPGDTFPAPAPAGAPTGTTLNAFYGSAPNGTWRLFVVDDSGENLGSITGSWNLTLETSLTACAFTLSQTVQTFPITGGNGSFGITMPTGCSWAATTDSPDFITINSATSGDGNGTVGFSVAPNMEGGRTGRIEISNGVEVRTFQVQQPSGCPFSLSQTAVNIGSSGGSRNVDVVAGNVCSWNATTNANWIQITSSQTTGNGQASFTVQPNPTQSDRSAVITVGARSFTVNQTGGTSSSFDFDGDGKTDISIFRPTAGEWWIQRSTSGVIAYTFGNSSDRIAPADFTGDGKTDIAIFRPSTGEWFVLRSEDGSYYSYPFGINGDIPAVGDFDLDGKADTAVFRPSDTNWYIRRSSDGGTTIQQFGINGDVPVVADYDSDGKSDIAIWRASAGQWWINKSTGGVIAFSFGTNTDKPVQGDYTGDGKADVAFFRPSTGEWFILRSEDASYYSFPFGTSTDIPAPGDYDGDGRFDAAVFRPTDTNWYVQRTTAGTLIQQFGINGDVPVPSAFVP